MRWPARRAKPLSQGEETRCALAPRRHGDVPVAQQLLEHRDRWSRIALLALGDRDGGVETLGRKAPLALAKRVCVDEHVAIVLIAHGRLGGAACGEAETNEQRDDRGNKK